MLPSPVVMRGGPRPKGLNHELWIQAAVFRESETLSEIFRVEPLLRWFVFFHQDASTGRSFWHLVEWLWISHSQSWWKGARKGNFGVPCLNCSLQPKRMTMDEMDETQTGCSENQWVTSHLNGSVFPAGSLIVVFLVIVNIIWVDGRGLNRQLAELVGYPMNPQ